MPSKAIKAWGIPNFLPEGEEEHSQILYTTTGNLTRQPEEC